MVAQNVNKKSIFSIINKKNKNLFKLHNLYNLSLEDVRELIKEEQKNLSNINKSIFLKNNGSINDERLIKFIEIFIVNNRNLKRKDKGGRTMGVFYKSYTNGNTNQKIKNFHFSPNDNKLVIDNIDNLIEITNEYITIESRKKNSSQLSSAIKRHEINLLILNFLLNILNEKKKKKKYYAVV